MIVLLHRRQTHSGSHCCVVWLRFGARPCVWRGVRATKRHARDGGDRPGLGVGSIMGSGGLVRVELQCGMLECRVGYPGPSMALCAWCVHPRGFVHLPGSIVAGR